MSVGSPRVAELAELITRHAQAREPLLPGLRLARVDAPTEPVSSLADPALVVVAQGAKRLTLGDRVYQYGAGEYLVVSLDLPVTGQFTDASAAEPFLGLSLRLEPYAITSLLAETQQLQYARPVQLPTGALGVSRAGPDLLDALIRLLRLLDARDDAPVLAPLIEKEIVWRLLCSEHRDLVRTIGLNEGIVAHVRDVIAWIRDHYAEPFRVEDLARRANMSVSSFHRHFRTATAMGPLHYQKKIRLQQARILLAGKGGDVTRIAHDVGYQSASQFSREYRREFGLPPARDLRPHLEERVGFP